MSEEEKVSNEKVSETVHEEVAQEDGDEAKTPLKLPPIGREKPREELSPNQNIWDRHNVLKNRIRSLVNYREENARKKYSFQEFRQQVEGHKAQIDITQLRHELDSIKHGYYPPEIDADGHVVSPTKQDRRQFEARVLQKFEYLRQKLNTVTHIQETQLNSLKSAFSQMSGNYLTQLVDDVVSIHLEKMMHKVFSDLAETAFGNEEAEDEAVEEDEGAGLTIEGRVDGDDDENAEEEGEEGEKAEGDEEDEKPEGEELDEEHNRKIEIEDENPEEKLARLNAEVGEDFVETESNTNFPVPTLEPRERNEVRELEAYQKGLLQLIEGSLQRYLDKNEKKMTNMLQTRSQQMVEEAVEARLDNLLGIESRPPANQDSADFDDADGDGEGGGGRSRNLQVDTDNLDDEGAPVPMTPAQKLQKLKTPKGSAKPINVLSENDKEVWKQLVQEIADFKAGIEATKGEGGLFKDGENIIEKADVLAEEVEKIRDRLLEQSDIITKLIGANQVFSENVNAALGDVAANAGRGAGYSSAGGSAGSSRANSKSRTMPPLTADGGPLSEAEEKDYRDAIKACIEKFGVTFPPPPQDAEEGGGGVREPFHTMQEQFAGINVIEKTDLIAAEFDSLKSYLYSQQEVLNFQQRKISHMERLVVGLDIEVIQRDWGDMPRIRAKLEKLDEDGEGQFGVLATRMQQLEDRIEKFEEEKEAE